MISTFSRVTKPLHLACSKRSCRVVRKASILGSSSMISTTMDRSPEMSKPGHTQRR